MSTISEAMGPLPPQFVIIDRRVAATSSPTCATLASPNPLRWALMIAAPMVKSSGLVEPSWISPVADSANPISGFSLSANQPNMLMTFRDFGALVQEAWYGSSLSATGTSAWDVIEVLIQQ